MVASRENHLLAAILVRIYMYSSQQETLRAMQRLVDIFRRVIVGSGEAKNPLTAGAAERREWQQYEDATAALNELEVRCMRKGHTRMNHDNKYS